MIPDSMKRGLEDFVGAADRRHPMVFSGRGKEMLNLEGLASGVASASSTPVRTACRIIHGSPGVGKSTLCAEFISRMNAGAFVEVGGKRKPLAAARLSPASLRLPPLQLVRSLDEQVARLGRRNYSRGLLKLFSAAAGVFQTGERYLRSEGLAALKQKRHRLSEQSTLDDCLGAFAENIWKPGLTLAVCIDEAQNCSAEDETAMDNLQALYNGEHHGRVALYCFGLADTEQKMRDMGISRIDDDAKIHLGALNPGEGGELLEKNLDAIGLSAANREWMDHARSIGMSPDDWRSWRGTLVERVEQASDNFPQHLNAGLRAACQVILDSPGNAPLGEPELDRIMGLHSESRIAYYRGRLGDKNITRHRTALGALCVLFERLRKAGRKAMASRVEAKRLLEIGDDDGNPVSASRCEQAMNAAMAKGVLESLELHPDGRGIEDASDYVLPPPIPSMETHLASYFSLKVGDKSPVALAMEKELDEIMPKFDQ